MRLCKSDDSTWQWSELADACYILNCLCENLNRKGVSNHKLLSVSDDEEPAVIVTGELPVSDIQSFLLNAVESRFINEESSPSDLNHIDERYYYGIHEGVKCTYIFPVKDMWQMVERTCEVDWSENELENMMHVEGVERSLEHVEEYW